MALAGAPNVGKSSLLNAFLREERAIVTSVPGTTRDIIEESVSIGGLLFNLSDTAGLRESTDPIEQEGVRRAKERLANCDILLLMLDSTRPLHPAEVALSRNLISEVEARGAACLVAINKVDLSRPDSSKFGALSDALSRHQVVEISAKTLEGFARLEDELVKLALGGSVATEESGIMITNVRHYSALQKARESLVLARESTLSRKSGEFIALDLRAGLDSLGEILGIVTTDDILNSIFANFCIGK